MIIDRNIINDNINYDGYSKEELCKLINRWKRLLTTKYNVKKGDLFALAIFDVNVNHICCIFAAAELGLRLFTLTKPVSIDTLHATKLAIHGPSDITVVSPLWVGKGEAEDAMIYRYSKQICMEYEVDEILDDSDVESPVITEDDILLATSTSGTTRTSRLIEWTHGDWYNNSTNIAKTMKVNKNNVFFQGQNLHHSIGFTGAVLPGLMQVDTNYGGRGVPFYNNDDEIEKFVLDMFVDKGVDLTMVHQVYMENILRYIELHKDKIRKRISFITAGYAVPEKYYDLCKRAPVNFHNIYGSTEAGGPIFYKFVDNTSEYIPFELGEKNDFFDLDFTDDGIFVSSSHWKGERLLLEDNIEFKDGKWFLYPREEDPYIPNDFKQFLEQSLGEITVISRKGERPDVVFWEIQEKPNFGTISMTRITNRIFYGLNKNDFMGPNKLNMEELRAYLETIDAHQP